MVESQEMQFIWALFGVDSFKNFLVQQKDPKENFQKNR